MNQQFKFTEIQYFRQWWLWIFLIGLAVFTLYVFYKQLILGVPFGDKPMSDLGLMVYTVFVACFIAMFYFMRLKTEINKEEIKIHFAPFTKKTIPWDDVQQSELITYGFVGGWGIRLGTKYGTVYNIKGNKGLALELKSGKKLMIGTQREDELKELLNKVSLQ
jgi:hypothetical protein